MLWFLLKKLRNIKQRHRFLYKTILLSAAVHCLVACIALLTTQFSSHVFVLERENVHKYGRVMLIPLARRVTPNFVSNNQTEETQIDLGRLNIENEKKELAVTEIAPTQNIVENSQLINTQEKIEKLVEQSQEVISKKEELAQATKDEVMYVGRDDLNEIKLYKMVFNAVEKVWQPPAGLPADSACEIAFIVKEGKAHNVEILKSSKIAAYDIAARCAVARADFERQAYGKKCTVIFKL